MQVEERCPLMQVSLREILDVRVGIISLEAR